MVEELKSVTEVFQCSGQKWWDYDAAKSEWGWTRPPPESQKPTGEVRTLRSVPTAQPSLTSPFFWAAQEEEADLRAAAAAQGVWLQAVQQRAERAAEHAVRPHVLQGASTPGLERASAAAHALASAARQACLETKFTGIADTRERAAPTGRAMREAKIVKPCPQCKFDLAEFMKGAQVNIDMAAIIGNLQRAAAAHAEGGAGAGGSDDDEQEDEEEVRLSVLLVLFVAGPDTQLPLRRLAAQAPPRPQPRLA